MPFIQTTKLLVHPGKNFHLAAIRIASQKVVNQAIRSQAAYPTPVVVVLALLHGNDSVVNKPRSPLPN